MRIFLILRLIISKMEQKTLDLNRYAPIISEKIQGDDMYSLIKSLKPETNKIVIDFSSIKAMTTFCAKQIFGKLYLELTANVFYENIILKNVSEDVKFSISFGIKSAVKDSQTSK